VHRVAKQQPYRNQITLAIGVAGIIYLSDWECDCWPSLNSIAMRLQSERCDSRGYRALQKQDELISENVYAQGQTRGRLKLILVVRHESEREVLF
jgi:hypothetical protein